MRFSRCLVPAFIAGVCSGAAVRLEERAICNVVDPVYYALKTPLKATATSFCSSYLGYPRTTSITVTASAPTVTRTSTFPASTVTTQTTQTNTFSNTATTTITHTPDPVTTTTTVTAGQQTYTKRDNIARSASSTTTALPSALKIFAASKISSACSCIVTPSTKTVTITAPNTRTATVISTVPATYSVTITQTITVATTVATTITSDVIATPVTSTVTETSTSVDADPTICNAPGNPRGDASSYNSYESVTQSVCIGQCARDARCSSTAFTTTSANSVTGICFLFRLSVTDTAVLGPGDYIFNDKAC